MGNTIFPDFRAAVNYAFSCFTEETVHTERWQGVEIQNNPAAAMHEVLNFYMQVPLLAEDLPYYQYDIQPNLPWADDHFLERVSGEPLNPGRSHEYWPFAFKGKESMQGGQYNHNYMERMWPKYAGMTKEGKLSEGGQPLYPYFYEHHNPRIGIRHEYGDLGDLVELLAEEPLTRQAYLPIWFPEDTGVVHNGRKPCTLGYHFILRNNLLQVTYYIRSCDFYRHFKDDIYLTVRLLLWILEELRKRNSFWYNVRPGLFNMHIVSLHMFVNDYKMLKKKGFWT